MAFEKDTDVWIPFRVVDADGDGVTGQNAAALSGMKFKQLTQSGTASTAFTEVDTGAADYEVNDLGEGDYEVMIPGSGGATANNDAAGLCWVNGAASGGKFVPVFVEIIDPAYPDLLKLFLDIIDQNTGQLDSGSFASGAITAASIASNAITADKIASDAITAAKIATDAIDADALATDAINEINATVDTALADIHLDHLLAVDYDPASKPGTATALLNELVESDSGVSRFTSNALEQALQKTLTEPGGVPAWTDTLEDAVNWLLALTRNRVTQTSTTQALRNDADSSDIATSTVSDDGTTFSRGEWS